MLPGFSVRGSMNLPKGNVNVPLPVDSPGQRHKCSNIRARWMRPLTIAIGFLGAGAAVLTNVRLRTMTQMSGRHNNHAM
jgi:hypothetical protein